jgi:hypothetical protein
MTEITEGRFWENGAEKGSPMGRGTIGGGRDEAASQLSWATVEGITHSVIVTRQRMVCCTLLLFCGGAQRIEWTSMAGGCLHGASRTLPLSRTRERALAESCQAKAVQ